MPGPQRRILAGCRGRRRPAGIVDQDIDGAELPLDGRHMAVDRAEVGEVPLQRQRRPPSASIAAKVRPAARVDIRHDHLGAFARQRLAIAPPSPPPAPSTRAVLSFNCRSTLFFLFRRDGHSAARQRQMKYRFCLVQKIGDLSEQRSSQCRDLGDTDCPNDRRQSGCSRLIPRSGKLVFPGFKR